MTNKKILGIVLSIIFTIILLYIIAISMGLVNLLIALGGTALIAACVVLCAYLLSDE